jgi:hypothetical protein
MHSSEMGAGAFEGYVEYSSSPPCWIYTQSGILASSESHSPWWKWDGAILDHTVLMSRHSSRPQEKVAVEFFQRRVATLAMSPPVARILAPFFLRPFSGFPINPFLTCPLKPRGNQPETGLLPDNSTASHGSLFLPSRLCLLVFNSFEFFDHTGCKTKDGLLPRTC